MLFGKLNQRSGGPEIAGAVRLEPDDSDNAVVVPLIPLAPDALSSIDQELGAILLCRAGNRGVTW